MVQSKKQGKYITVFNAVLYVSSASACADPGIFTKWGGGGPRVPGSDGLFFGKQ